MIIRIVNKKTRAITATFDDRDFEVVIGISPMGTLEKPDEKIDHPHVSYGGRDWKNSKEAKRLLEPTTNRPKIKHDGTYDMLETTENDSAPMFLLENQTTFVAQIGDDDKPQTHLATIVKCYGVEFLRIDLEADPKIKKTCEESISMFAASNPSDELLHSIKNGCANGEHFWVQNDAGEKVEFFGVDCDDGVARWRPVCDYPGGRPKVAGGYVGGVGASSGVDRWKNLNKLSEIDRGYPVKAIRVRSGVDGDAPLWAACEMWMISGVDIIKWDNFDQEGWDRTVKEINRLAVQKNEYTKEGGVFNRATKIKKDQVGAKIVTPQGAVLEVVECEGEGDSEFHLAVMTPTPAMNVGGA